MEGNNIETNINIRNDKQGNGYFIVIDFSNNDDLSFCESKYILDDDIARFLGLSLEYYKNKLIEFGAIDKDSGLFFEIEKFAYIAKQWIEDNIDNFLIIKKMEGTL